MKLGASVRRRAPRRWHLASILPGAPIELIRPLPAGSSSGGWRPRRKGEPAADGPQTSPPTATGRNRIVIVEDDWLIAANIEFDLEAAGFVVGGIAADLDTALEIVEQERPDLVLMDIRLRGPVDGIEIARMLVERFGVPIIFATAHADHATMGRAAVAQPVGWLSKPFSSGELVALVRRVLSGDA